MKKIGLFCLCLASLTLVGCFHVPDEDWIFSSNKTETGEIEKKNDMNEALDTFMNGIDIISSGRDELNNNENYAEESQDTSLDTEDEIIEDEETIENKVKNEEVENENIVTEE